jgi:hypothetical protein
MARKFRVTPKIDKVPHPSGSGFVKPAGEGAEQGDAHWLAWKRLAHRGFVELAPIPEPAAEAPEQDEAAPDEELERDPTAKQFVTPEDDR